MSISNENEAYHILVKALLKHVGNDTWDRLVLNTEIFNKMSRSEKIIYSSKKVIEEYRELPSEILISEHNAAIYLRDHLINLTGDRIWGLTFTLYPDGKFEIDYDYDKPEDYEETDEVFTGKEINQTFLK